MKGATLPDNEKQQVIDKLADFTGLSKEYLNQTNLRINIRRFAKELLRKDGRTVGRLDSRFKGWDRDSAGEQYEYDPSMAAIDGSFSSTLNDYLRVELGYHSDLPYVILGGRINFWDYSSNQNTYVNVAETLRSTMTQNPHLKIFVANGYYDLATPYFATEYTFNHMELPDELRRNVSMKYYEAGHMMYINIPSLQQLKNDLSGFINDANRIK